MGCELHGVAPVTETPWRSHLFSFIISENRGFDSNLLFYSFPHYSRPLSAKF